MLTMGNHIIVNNICCNHGERREGKRGFKWTPNTTHLWLEFTSTFLFLLGTAFFPESKV